MVALPHCRLPKLHIAAGRKVCFTDVPTSKLAPVVHWRSQPQRWCLDVFRRLAAQDADGDCRHPSSEFLSGKKRPPHAALPKITVHTPQHPPPLPLSYPSTHPLTPH